MSLFSRRRSETIGVAEAGGIGVPQRDRPTLLHTASGRYSLPVTFDLAVTDDAVLLAVRNDGPHRLFMASVRQQIGLIGGWAWENKERHWYQRDRLVAGPNGYEEMREFDTGDIGHVVLPWPANRYVMSVGVWGLTTPKSMDSKMAKCCLVATTGTRLEHGVSSVGATAWFIDEPLIWAMWGISTRDGVVLSQ